MVAEPLRLTQFSHGAGCACKLSPADLRTVLGLVRGLENAPADPDLMVGFDTSDDAAVYRLRPDLAIVVTTDFFTPIVDDPYDWGRISATNALSDVYAMGGTPLLALNLVAWPREGLPFELLARVLDGGGDVVRNAGAFDCRWPLDRRRGAEVRARGRRHRASRSRVHERWRATPATRLVLTKPIGLGVISTALKRDAAPPALVQTAIDVMTTLNAGARDAATELGSAVHAATDVTGFGLLGHLRELVRGSGVGATIDADAVPVIDGVRDLLAAGMVAGGTQRNHAFVSDSVDFGDLPESEQMLLADAQTSGGLLLSVAPDAVDDLVAALERHHTLAAAVIGHTTSTESGQIRVTTG